MVSSNKTHAKSELIYMTLVLTSGFYYGQQLWGVLATCPCVDYWVLLWSAAVEYVGFWVSGMRNRQFILQTNHKGRGSFN
jgi:hypothetical protein